VRFAQDEARNLQHDYIGTEHILLGLLHDEESVAAKALRQLDLDQERLRKHIEEVVGPGPGTPPGRINFTPRAKKILELALREALALHHSYIGTEHILLAIGREGEGVAAQALAEQGIDESRIRGVVIALLSGMPGRVQVAPEPPEPQYLAVDLDGPAEQWTSQLNDLADDGWELVSLQQLGQGTRAVLRRVE
jgi:ATP-dependent Clp protease ATP-binding subunit ClpC